MSNTKLTIIIPIDEFNVLMENNDVPYSISGNETYVVNRLPEKVMIGQDWLDLQGDEVAIQVNIEKVLRRIEVPKLVEVGL